MCLYIHSIYNDMDEKALDININPDRQVTVSVTTTLEELAKALKTGRLVIDLNQAEVASAGPGALTAAEVRRICGQYGAASFAANLLWEIAQAGDAGITSTVLKEVLGLSSSQRLAGVFSGLGKTLERLVPGRKGRFLGRQWLTESAEYRYRMPAEVRATVLGHYG